MLINLRLIDRSRSRQLAGEEIQARERRQVIAIKRVAVGNSAGESRRLLPHRVLRRPVPRQLHRRVDGVVPAGAGVLCLPAVHREGQILVPDVARRDVVGAELGGDHGGGAGGGVREGEEGVGADHSLAGGVDGPRHPSGGALQRAVGDVEGAVRRVEGPEQSGVEVRKPSAGAVAPAAGERNFAGAAAALSFRLMLEAEQNQEEDCELHDGRSIELRVN